MQSNYNETQDLKLLSPEMAFPQFAGSNGLLVFQQGQSQTEKLLLMAFLMEWLMWQVTLK